MGLTCRGPGPALSMLERFRTVITWTCFLGLCGRDNPASTDSGEQNCSHRLSWETHQQSLVKKCMWDESLGKARYDANDLVQFGEYLQTGDVNLNGKLLTMPYLPV